LQLTTEEDVRLAKRKERFGVAEAAVEGKKNKRAERFGSISTSAAATSGTEAAPTVTTAKTPAPAETDEKKKQRAARFAGAP
jgi:hypothetical protein